MYISRMEGDAGLAVSLTICVLECSGGMTKQEVTSVSDCSAPVHFKDNPFWQYVPPGPGRPHSLL